MKLILGILACLALASCSTPPAPAKRTLSSFDRPTGAAAERVFQAGAFAFTNAEVPEVLAKYQEISGRTVISGASLPSPKISLRNELPLNRVEALRLLDTVMAQNGITMVLSGDDAVKAVPTAAAVNETPPTIDLPEADLPDSKSYMLRIVKLTRIRS